MKITTTYIVAATVFVAFAIPVRLRAQNQEKQSDTQTRYTVRALGSLGGTSCCQSETINNLGWVDGNSDLAGDQNFHPFLWRDGQMIDLGTLGGPNSNAGGMNELGDVTVGGSDTGIPDPLGEDFCHYGTYQTCLSFLWHNGRRTLVPTLGGNNNDVATINNHRQVLVIAETANADPTCTAPQVLGFEGFIWEPRTGGIRKLPPLFGDSVSGGFGMNESGDVTGASGICADVSSASALHIALWRSGRPIDLGNLGGATGNFGFALNNRGQVVGQSDLTGDNTFHAILWQGGILTDLGTLPGDFASTATGINDGGQIAITSCDANFNCRAAIWQNGVMTDLNTLIPPGSPLFLTGAGEINARGQIAGTALDQTGAVVPFLATPCDEKNAAEEECGVDAQVALPIAGDRHSPENVRDQAQRRFGLGPRMFRPR
jgi:probable HAF family extracellular repeat protein